MRQFDHYPVYINHPGRWNEVRERQLEEFASKGDTVMVNWLSPAATGAELYETMVDMSPRPEARDYESQIYQLLRLIASTRIGKFLLDSLDRSQKYWIVPKENFGVDCGCKAVAFPGTPKGGGGIRVYLTPKELSRVQTRWESADDILFHELVHAYRIGQVGFNSLKRTPMNEYKDAEEFFALHMQNVYLALRGGKRFYRDYRSLRSVSKDTAYQYFAGDAEVLMAFRYFLDNDPVLAPEVAKWTHPADSFNPWRDQAVLERIYLGSSDLKGVTHLPAF